MNVDQAIKDSIAGRNMEGVRMQAEDWLTGHGLSLPTDPVEARRALNAWAQIAAKSRQGMRLRDVGEPVDTPPKVPLPASITPENSDPAKKTVVLV